MTIKDLMQGRMKAEIRCPYQGIVVRRLTVDGDNLKFDHMEGVITLPLSTELLFEPWTFDRGNILFRHADYGLAKFCTEADILAFDGETEHRVIPDDTWNRLQRQDYPSF